MESSSSNSNLAYEIPGVLLLYKDGGAHILQQVNTMPPTDDPATGVHSKDVVVSHEKGLSARLFIPRTTDVIRSRKLPLVVYIHGGVFCFNQPSAVCYYDFLVSLVNEASAMVAAISYRKYPEYPLPVAFEESWEAIRWLTNSHVGRDGPEPWINEHADFGRVYLVGDSSGATITQHMGIQVGLHGLNRGVNVAGMVLVQPYFADSERAQSLMGAIFPSRQGWAEPMVNPVAAGPGHLARLGCGEALVCVAGDDHLINCGLSYYEGLKNSGWAGKVELFVTKGEKHAFLFDEHRDEEKFRALVHRVACFINGREKCFLFIC